MCVCVFPVSHIEKCILMEEINEIAANLVKRHIISVYYSWQTSLVTHLRSAQRVTVFTLYTHFTTNDFYQCETVELCWKWFQTGAPGVFI